MRGFLPALTRPVLLGAFFFGLTLAYVPGVLNLATAGRWALLALALPLLLGSVGRVTAGHWSGALLLGWAALSLAWTPQIWDGLRAVYILVLFGLAFSIGARLDSLRPVYLGLGLGMAVNGLLVLAQWGGFDGVYILNAPAGLFVNKNWLAETAAPVLVGVIAYRLWWLIPPILPCVLVAPAARTALLGLGAAALVWLWPRSRMAALTVVAFAAAFAASRLGEHSAMERFDIWRDTANGLTWLGRGIGAFWHDYPSHAGLKDLLLNRPAQAHNDFLQILYELGPLGLGLFLALLAVAMTGQSPAMRAVLAAILMEACLAFPLQMPVTGCLFAVVLGHACRGGGDVRGLLAAGRMALRQGAVGLGHALRRAGAHARRGGGVSA